MVGVGVTRGDISIRSPVSFFVTHYEAFVTEEHATPGQLRNLLLASDQHCAVSVCSTR